MNEHDQNIDNLSVDPNAILYSMINSLSDKVMDLEKENALLKAEIDQLCERDQLLEYSEARIADLENTVLKLESFVDLHYARIRES